MPALADVFCAALPLAAAGAASCFFTWPGAAAELPDDPDCAAAGAAPDAAFPFPFPFPFPASAEPVDAPRAIISAIVPRAAVVRSHMVVLLVLERSPQLEYDSETRKA